MGWEATYNQRNVSTFHKNVKSMYYDKKGGVWWGAVRTCKEFTCIFYRNDKPTNESS
ncbi:hypothetical protein LguiA_003906 [Lonicera macranthoides]